MKKFSNRSPRRSDAPPGSHHRRVVLLSYLFAWALTTSIWAAPFDKLFDFTQPDGTRLQLHGRGDEFSARFESLDGYTVVFDQDQRAYCFARQDANGKLISTGVQVQSGDPAALSLARGIRMSDEARKQMVVQRHQLWEQGMQIQQRWSTLKASAASFYTPAGKNGPQPSPPPFTTTGLKVGLTLLIDFSDDPATIPQAEIINYCNGDNYTGYGNNGSVKKYFYDNSNGQLTYTNVVTIYIRVPQPKTYYNDLTKDCGDQGNLLLKDAIDAMKALPNYTTEILPTFDPLTVDDNNQVVACNVFFAGANSGVWTFGLWPHSWALYNVGAQELSPGGKQIWRYQITDIGNALAIGTFCHENGHMLCGYPDIYDYDYDSVGGAGNFCLMDYGGFDQNPVQIDAYLKRASGWATTTELSSLSSLVATVTASAGSNFNHFYRFQKPGVATEYYLIENRQQSGHDALIPGSGIAIWHVDELGDRDNQSLAYNTTHANYELTLVQADNLWDFENNENAGDAQDLYYAGNPASGYANQFTDTTAPGARWWDGSLSGLVLSDFSSSGPTMTFGVGSGVLSIASVAVLGGNGNGLVDNNECNDLQIFLGNSSGGSATGVSGSLSSSTPGVIVVQALAPYPAIPNSTTNANLTPFRISIAPTLVCGMPIDFTLVVKSDQFISTNQFRLPTGVPGTPLRFDNSTPVPIPDLGEGNSTVVVSNVNSALSQVTVALYITHTFDADLLLQLISPDGTTNTLSANNGGGGNNYGAGCFPDSGRTTFDDAALQQITSGNPPFVGVFQPQTPLSVFAGKAGTNVNGAWRLRAVDRAGQDFGTIQCWSLFLTPAQCTDGGGECPGADLALGMTAQPEPVIVGGSLTYTITVTNRGPSSAKNVTVTHLLPSSVIFVSVVSSQGTCSQSAGLVTGNLGTLATGAGATVTVVGMPSIAGTVSSTASVNSSEPDPDTSNNSATVVSQVVPASADLVAGIAATPNPVVLGGTLIYTVTVTNRGPSGSSGVLVGNALSADVTVLSATVTQGSITPGGNLWTVGTLPVGAGAVATITVVPTQEGSITATSTAQGNQLDTLPANNTATTTTIVGAAADLAISITDFPDPTVVSSNLTYLIAVTNLGPSAATSVTVNDFLPANAPVLSTNASQGTIAISAGTLAWDVGALASGAKATLTIVVTTVTNGVLTTSATVASAQNDPNPANNSASATTEVALRGVSIVAAAATLTAESFAPPNGAIDIDETVTIILRLRNSSNASTLNLVGTLMTNAGVMPVPPNNPQSYGVLAPSGFPVGRPFTFTASGTNGQTISPTLLLRDGATTYPPVTFTFTLPNTRAYTNTNAIVIRDNTNALAYPSTILVSGFTGTVGRVTAKISNLTHTYAPDVDVLLVAPDGQKSMLMSGAGGIAGMVNATLTFDDAAPFPVSEGSPIYSGSYQPANYFGANLPGPAPVGPYLAAMSMFNGANPNGTWSLFVNDHTAGDTGSIAGGWSLAFTTITPVNQLADLYIAALDAPDPIAAGEALTYTFTVGNFGPNVASSVAFTNVLPAGVTLVSASSSQGTVITNATTVLVNLGPLASGAAATVTVMAVPSLAAIPFGQNSVILTSTAGAASSETDPNPANNSLSVGTTVQRPIVDLGVSLVATPSPASAGNYLTNSIVITNRGPAIAADVVLTNPLPAGAAFVSAVSSAGSCSNIGGAIVCSLGSLPANSSATVAIILTPSLLGLLTNTVSVATASHDTNAANNTASYVVSVASPATQILSVGAVITQESGPVNGLVDAGETVTVSLALANIGSLDTVNLKATLLPSGGVTSPSLPQNYGALIRGGAAVAKSFTFTATSVPGAAVVATLQVRDERPGVTNNLGTAAFTFNSPSTSVWSSPSAIVIPDHGIAAPYPSAITVSGLFGVLTKATVTLKQVSHNFPHDVSVLLVSPDGVNVLLMSHTGGGHAVTNLTLTFDDSGANILPSGDSLGSKTYKPGSYPGPISFFPPAPAAPYAAVLGGLNGRDPNGVWTLYVLDDATGDAGTIAGGWSLDLATASPLRAFTDLAVAMTSAPGSLLVGETLTSTVWVTNLGPTAATAVMLTNQLSSGQQVITNLGSLAVNASVQATLLMTPSLGGSITNTARVGWNEADLNLSNNSAQTVTAVIDPVPAMLTGSIVGGSFQLTVNAESGQAYVIEGSTNLVSWQSLSTNTVSPGGTIKYTDTNTPNFKQRFYRTQRVTP